MSRENLSRMAWAAVRTYAQESGRAAYLPSDPSVMDLGEEIGRELIGDLITDLLHLAKRNALDVDDLLGSVSENFEIERMWDHAGTVSSGTLRTEDLLPAFADKLRELAPGALRKIYMPDVAKDFAFDMGEWVAHVLSDDDKAAEVLDELDRALNDVAPAEYYFGTLEGDGAHFGFWRIAEDDRAEECSELEMAGAL